MFHHAGVIIAPILKTSASHVDIKSRLEKSPSHTSLRRSTSRLRKLRWSIYEKIRLKENDVKSVLGYYKSLIMRFIKRFSMRLKPKEPGIWKEKLSRTVKDVKKFLGEKTPPNSTHSTSTVKFKSASKVGIAFDISSKTEKNKNVVKKAEIARSAGNVKTQP